MAATFNQRYQWGRRVFEALRPNIEAHYGLKMDFSALNDRDDFELGIDAYIGDLWCGLRARDSRFIRECPALTLTPAHRRGRG